MINKGPGGFAFQSRNLSIPKDTGLSSTDLAQIETNRQDLLCVDELLNTFLDISTDAGGGVPVVTIDDSSPFQLLVMVAEPTSGSAPFSNYTVTLDFGHPDQNGRQDVLAGVSLTDPATALTGYTGTIASFTIDSAMADLYGDITITATAEDSTGTVSTGGAATTACGKSGMVKSTDFVPEGAANLYFTDARAQAAVPPQTALQVAVADVTNNFVGSDVETVMAELAAMVTGMAHTAITGVDLKSTGVPNQFTVEITWTDEDGNTQTTTDPTPITFVDNQLTAQLIKAGPNSTPAVPTILIENTVGGVVLASNEYSLPSAKNWGHYAVNWVPDTTTTAITGGVVREYTSSDPSSPVYRFEPDPYVHFSDAFYDDFDGTAVSNLLAARG